MPGFVDEPKIHFPGVELVVETELSRGRDPYLDDHIVNGHALLPAVLGLEAMAQVAAALTPPGTGTAIRAVSFDRPLYVTNATRIRIATLRVDAATTEVFLSAEDDGFSTPYMRATFGAPGQELTNPSGAVAGSGPKVPAGALYGPLFFNGGRFRRIHHFELATSRRILAQLSPAPETRWFGAYEPPDLVLWDPGATDAALHALQVTIPHRRVLPVSVERIEVDAMAGPAATVSAIERAVQGNMYHFDLAITDTEGRVAQRWTNATFRAVDDTVIDDVLAAAPMLAACYLERVARDSLGDDTIAVSVDCEPSGTRQSRRDAVIAQLGLDGLIDRRADGRPVRVDGEGSVSVAYGHHVAIAMTARDLVGCDIELVHGPEQASNGSIRRHTVLEACRKVGRTPSISALQRLSARASFRINDIRVVTVDLPLAAGQHSVAFCRLMRAAPIIIQDHQIAATEVSL